MQESSGEARAPSPSESWQTIHSTMEAARSSMYLTGTNDDNPALGRHSVPGVSVAARHHDAGAGLRG